MGTLYIVSTPIGNLEDITIRAIKTLFSVDYIACEDTRKTGQLLVSLKTRSARWQAERSEAMTPPMVNRSPKLISYYDEIEFKRVPEIIELLQQNKNVALVSDSGTPLISDPGFKLVQECIKRSIRIVSIPGPTSLITALTSSGLPLNNFLFLGYLPAKSTKRVKLFKSLKDLRHLGGGRLSLRSHDSPDGEGTIINPTIIFFETPHRIKESLEDLKEVFGDIEIVICREMTKIHEEVWRGEISNAMNNDFKGELILLINIPQV